MSSPKDRARRWLAAILLVAAAARIAYALLVWTPAFVSPAETMSKMYVRSAYALCADLGYAQALPGSDAYHDLQALVREGQAGAVVTADAARRVSRKGLYAEMLHPPGWAMAAAVLHRAFGVPVTTAMHWFSVCVDVAACALLFVLARSVLGSARVALVAAAIYAVFPPLCYASATLRPKAMMPFFVILATLVIMRAARAGGPRRWMLLAACGAALGVGGYFRPDFLLLGPFLCLGLWATDRRLWLVPAAAAVVLAASLAVLLPWARRNHSVCGRWVFTSSGVGCTLVTGLGTYPNPWGFGPSDEDRVREAARAGFATPFSPQADLYFRRVFLRAVRERPWAYVKILARRTVQPIATPYGSGLKLPARTRSFTELRSTDSVLGNVGYLWRAFWPRIIMAGVSFAGLCAMVFMLIRERRRRPAVWFLALVPLYAAGSHLLSHMAPYYLLPGVFAQLTGLAYVLARPRRHEGAASQPQTEGAAA